MAAVKHESSCAHPKESSVISLLSGWAQQGAQTLFATQRILIDLAMRQNATVMHAIKQQLSDSQHSPTALLSEVAGEGMTNFLEGQKILLNLGKEQNELLMEGIRERLGDSPRREALIDLLRRSVDSFLEMQEEFLTVADRQAHAWVDAAKAGKPYQPERLVDLARQGMDSFVKAQKQFLDVISEETTKATGGRHANGAARKMKPIELSELARNSTDAFIEAQKRLVDVAGRQVNANLKITGKAMELLQPFPFLPLNELTREVVKSYVEAQKALMDTVIKRPEGGKTAETARRPVRRAAKKQKPKVEAAVA
jgi:hypothetical protein